MQVSEKLKKFWRFLKEDTWQSWIISLILVIIFIRFIFFPTLSFITGSPLPLVVVESCSMYHESSYGEWWNDNHLWYEEHSIPKDEFDSFPFRGGLNKGDIIFVWGRSTINKGDVVIFTPNDESNAPHPIIHRIVAQEPFATKGDHNALQLTKYNNAQGIDETNIDKDQIIGRATVRIPYLGWVKLIFFEPLRPANARGFCK